MLSYRHLSPELLPCPLNRSPYLVLAPCGLFSTQQSDRAHKTRVTSSQLPLIVLQSVPSWPRSTGEKVEPHNVSPQSFSSCPLITLTPLPSLSLACLHSSHRAPPWSGSTQGAVTSTSLQWWALCPRHCAPRHPLGSLLYHFDLHPDVISSISSAGPTVGYCSLCSPPLPCLLTS